MISIFRKALGCQVFDLDDLAFKCKVFEIRHFFYEAHFRVFFVFFLFCLRSLALHSHEEQSTPKLRYPRLLCVLTDTCTYSPHRHHYRDLSDLIHLSGLSFTVESLRIGYTFLFVSSVYLGIWLILDVQEMYTGWMDKQMNGSNTANPSSLFAEGTTGAVWHKRRKEIKAHGKGHQKVDHKNLDCHPCRPMGVPWAHMPWKEHRTVPHRFTFRSQLCHVLALRPSTLHS